jgi:nitrite reductase (NADH) small subunit
MGGLAIHRRLPACPPAVVIQMPWTKLANVGELPPGSVIEIARGEDLYALCNVDGEIRALSGVCPHRGGPLGEGALNGGLISCPWHMWEFDSATGICALNDGVRGPTYPVRLEDDTIVADLPLPELPRA